MHSFDELRSYRVFTLKEKKASAVPLRVSKLAEANADVLFLPLRFLSA